MGTLPQNEVLLQCLTSVILYSYFMGKDTLVNLSFVQLTQCLGHGFAMIFVAQKVLHE